MAKKQSVELWMCHNLRERKINNLGSVLATGLEALYKKVTIFSCSKQTDYNTKHDTKKGKRQETRLPLICPFEQVFSKVPVHFLCYSYCSKGNFTEANQSVSFSATMFRCLITKIQLSSSFGPS